MKGTKFCQLAYGFNKVDVMHISGGTKINKMCQIPSEFQEIWFGEQILSCTMSVARENQLVSLREGIKGVTGLQILTYK